MADGEAIVSESSAQEQEGEAVESNNDEEMIVRLFTLASEQIIQAIAKHADNPRPLAEKIARWLVEVLK